MKCLEPDNSVLAGRGRSKFRFVPTSRRYRFGGGAAIADLPRLDDNRRAAGSIDMIDEASFGRAAIKAGLVVVAVLALAACDRVKDRDKAEAWTMYQSNPTNLTARVHFATFNARLEGERKQGAPTANRYNCEMAAGVLNEKIRTANDGAQPVRYWCEKGKYREVADAKAE
jgi:hypothetical protein